MRFLMSGNLLRFSDFQNEITIVAPTLEEGLEELVESCPRLKPVLFDGEGRFRKVHRLFVNGDPLERGEIDRAMGADDEVTILIAIAGR
jgi:hypothetical protein